MLTHRPCLSLFQQILYQLHLSFESLIVYFPTSIQPIHHQIGVSHNLHTRLITPDWVPFLSIIMLQISSVVLTKTVPSLAYFPPSLGATPFRHEIIPIRVCHTNSSPSRLMLILRVQYLCFFALFTHCGSALSHSGCSFDLLEVLVGAAVVSSLFSTVRTCVRFTC